VRGWVAVETGVLGWYVYVGSKCAGDCDSFALTKHVVERCRHTR